MTMWRMGMTEVLSSRAYAVRPPRNYQCHRVLSTLGFCRSALRK